MSPITTASMRLTSIVTVQDVPYHNSLHAADVTLSMNTLLNSPALEVTTSIAIQYLYFSIINVIYYCFYDFPLVTMRNTFTFPAFV